MMKAKRAIKDIEHILPRIKEILKRFYGNRLDGIIVYGSFAINKATEDSDIDIAIVLKGKVNKIKEIDKIHDLIYPLSLEYGELISVNPISTEELEDTEWPLYYHIKNEGIKV